jgi:hypothetical protein
MSEETMRWTKTKEGHKPEPRIPISKYLPPSFCPAQIGMRKRQILRQGKPDIKIHRSLSLNHSDYYK